MYPSACQIHDRKSTLLGGELDKLFRELEAVRRLDLFAQVDNEVFDAVVDRCLPRNRLGTCLRREDLQPLGLSFRVHNGKRELR